MKKAIVLLGLTSAMSAFTGCSKDDVTENGWSNETKGRRDNTLVAKMAGDGGGRARRWATNPPYGAPKTASPCMLT